LQRGFEHLPEEQTRPLLDELHAYTTNLIQGRFIQPGDRSLLSPFPGFCCAIEKRKRAERTSDPIDVLIADRIARVSLARKLVWCED
jgi:hypothetical protein